MINTNLIITETTSTTTTTTTTSSVDNIEARCYGVPTKKGGTALLIIDPQNDFHEGGSLAVTGANADTERIAEMIETKQGMEQISQINVTLDSHQVIDISHNAWWVDAEGKHPGPFTLIELKDVQSGKWKASKPERQQRSLEYVETLEKMGKFKVCIWPNHCIIGSFGHCIKDRLNKAMHLWVKKNLDTINYQYKGSNIFTEMYSCLKAEMVLDDDPSTAMNNNLVKRLQMADRVLVCGQALSHCVNFTVRDLVSVWPKDQMNKLYVLEDGCSSVAGFEKAGEDFLAFCKDSGVNVIKCADVWTEDK